jgi:hypothetical protein
MHRAVNFSGDALVVEVVLPNSNCFREAELFSARDSGQPAVGFTSAKAPKLADLNSDFTILTAGH